MIALNWEQAGSRTTTDCSGDVQSHDEGEHPSAGVRRRDLPPATFTGNSTTMGETAPDDSIVGVRRG